jgi:hypothetical protein
MSRHKKHLKDSLGDYEETASPKVLETWFQFMSDRAAEPSVRELALKSYMSVDEVIQLGLEFDDCLVELYRDMTDKAESQDVKEAFTNLLRMEEQGKRNFVRQAVRVMDFR